MNKTTFSKTAATPEQLLAKLRLAGLDCTTAYEQTALAYLTCVGGYRLKGYWFHFVDPTTKRFPPGLRFEDIAVRYEFDRSLRTLTISAIDRLEVAIRTVMANYLSLKHSPHWFLTPGVFKPNRSWGMGQLIKKIEDEVHRSHEKRFVKHYFDKHDEPYLPPSWSVSECVTFGLWSRTYAILRDPVDKKGIAKKFGVDKSEVFESWIHALTVARNIAAHHGQLLRTKIQVAPANYKAMNIKFSDQKSFFAIATVVSYLLNQTGLPNTWKPDIEHLFAQYPSVALAELGFPLNWKSTSGW